MLSAGLTIELLTFNSSNYVNAARKFSEKQMKEGARVFAQVALSKIPVRTGFAAGSFGALSDLLGSSARLNPIVAFFKKITGKSNSLLSSKLKGLSLVKNEYYNDHGVKILKTPDNAREFATPQGEIFTWNGGILEFNFEVDISYFNISDVQASTSPSSPWQSFELGKEAMINFIAEDIESKLPKFEDFLKTRIVKVV